MSQELKSSKKQKARKLREEGLSYKEIAEKVGVSKSSVSLWCRDIKLTDQQKKRLKNKIREGAKKGRKVAAKLAKQRREERIRISNQKGKEKVGDVDDRDEFIAGLMLYAGKGSKSNNKVEVANSDPDVIEFMMNWFQNFYDKKPEDFWGSLYIHDDLNTEKAFAFWSELTKIPRENFRDPYVVESKSDSHRKREHKYGVIRVGFCDIDVHRQILGSIEKILN